MISQIIKSIRSVHATVWILLAMVLGIVTGYFFPNFSKDYLGLLSSAIFLPMIKACLVPLIFSTLVTGIASHGSSEEDKARVGRLAVKSLSYFISLTFLALFIGLAIANLFNPGAGVSVEGVSLANVTKSDITVKSELNKIFQPSFFQAAVGFNESGKPSNSGGEILAIVFMSVMFSMAIMNTKSHEDQQVMLKFNHSLSEIMFSVINLVMKFAAIAVFGAMSSAIGTSGLGVLASLGKLVGCLYLGLLVFFSIVLLPIMILMKVPLYEFGRAVFDPLMIAFSTASSDAALPLAMKNMIAFGCPDNIVAFVIPTGYTFNLDGTTLYLAVASVFAAEVSAVDMPIGKQVFMMLVLMLTSKGVAGTFFSILPSPY